jgi:NADH-quinone oxidoreductase subunit C
MEMAKERILEDISREFADSIISVTEQFGDAILLFEKEALLKIVEFLIKESYGFDMLLDLTCVDYQEEGKRFEVVYHLFSLKNKLRLRFKARLNEKDLEIDSLTSFFRNANWLEREAYDMFGVRFKGHPYLRRLFMYDGFDGHPLRKDYPLRKQQPKIPLRK